LDNPVKAIASCFSLVAFATAIVSGLAAGNPGRTILLNAVVCMILCQIIGMILGSMAMNVVEQHIDAHRRAHPVPDLEAIARGVPDTHRPSREPEPGHAETS
jgi:hypothetical protein